MTDLTPPAPALTIRYNGECVISHLEKHQKERLRETLAAHYPQALRTVADERDADGKFTFPPRVSFHLTLPRDAAIGELPELLAASGIAVETDRTALAHDFRLSFLAVVQATSHARVNADPSESSYQVGMEIENLDAGQMHEAEALGHGFPNFAATITDGKLHVKMDSAQDCIAYLHGLEVEGMEIARPQRTRLDLKEAEKEAQRMAYPGGDITLA